MKVIAPFLSCSVNLVDNPNGLAEALAEGYSIVYLTAPTGLFIHRQLSPGKDGAPRFIRQKVSSIPGQTVIPDVQPAINFLPAGKIPRILFHTVKAFFRKVIELKKTPVEAMIWIMWSQENGYFLHVPQQTVGPASAHYDWDNLPPNASIIVDIHSHSDFGAFFSGTDNRDDVSGIRYSGVIGNNLKPEPTHCWRFCFLDRTLEVKLEDIFEDDIKPQLLVEEDWLERVKSTSQVSYSGGYRGRHVRQGGSEEDEQTYLPGFAGYRGSIGSPPSPTSGGFPHHPGAPKANAEFSRHPFHPGGAATYPPGEGEEGGTDPKKASGSVSPANQKPTSEPNAKPTSSVGGPNQTPELPKASTQSQGNVVHLTPREAMGQAPALPAPTRAVTPTLPQAQATVSTAGPTVTPTAAGKTSSTDPRHPGKVITVPGDVEDLTAEEEKAIDQYFSWLRAQSGDTSIGALDQEDVLSRMHRRTFQESLLRDEEEATDGTDVNAVLGSDGELTITIPAMDIPPDFDAIAANHGPRAANAHAAISALSTDLIDTGTPLRATVAELFELIPDDEKLAMFRSLSGSLPQKALDSLAESGL